MILYQFLVIFSGGITINQILSKEWENVEIGDVINYEQPTKYLVKSEDYKDEYQTPVLTAGKTFLLGYTNEKDGIFTNLPVIIFDDFTTSSKFVTFPFKVKSSAMKLLTPKNKDVNLKYIYLLMQNIKINTTTHKRYYLSKYQHIKIPFPPVEIQNKFVNKFEKLEKLKHWRQESDTLTDDYLNSIFKEMFGDLGKNTNNYPIEKLINVCNKITDGEHNTPPRTDFGKPLLMAKNVRNDYIDFNEISYISENDHIKSWRRCNPEEGDILLVCVGATIGRVAIVPKYEQFSLVRSVALLKPDNNKINSQFLLWCLKSNFIQSKFLSRRNTSAQAGLYLKEIRKIEIPIPPISIQEEFSNIVNKVNQIKTYQRQNRIDLDDLFNSLMQKAFRGELNC